MSHSPELTISVVNNKESYYANLFAKREVLSLRDTFFFCVFF